MGKTKGEAKHRAGSEEAGSKKADTKKAGNGKSRGPSHAPEPLSKRDYLEQLEPMQIELNCMARWLQSTGRRLLVIFEGRDTAGKGGAINALSETLNPRQCRVVALPKPAEREQGQWYFQRYIQHLPAAGELTLFDRSWYNRAGVERVMGFCSEAQAKAFLKQVPVFEQLLVDDGVLLFKYWLTVDQAQQERRFAERLADPLKRWKLSPIDLVAREKYTAYGDARDQMLKATHTEQAPWTVIDFNDQRRGRLKLIRHLLDHLPDRAVAEDRLEIAPLTAPPEVEHLPRRWQPL